MMSIEKMERLVAMTNMSNLVALDKTLAAIRRSPGMYLAQAVMTASIAERTIRAIEEIGWELPEEQRVPKNHERKEPSESAKIISWRAA